MSESSSHCHTKVSLCLNKNLKDAIPAGDERVIIKVEHLDEDSVWLKWRRKVREKAVKHRKIKDELVWTIHDGEWPGSYLHMSCKQSIKKMNIQI